MSNHNTPAERLDALADRLLRESSLEIHKDDPLARDLRIVAQGVKDLIAENAELATRLAAVTLWLEMNQPDVFRRGLPDAINAASRVAALRAQQKENEDGR